MSDSLLQQAKAFVDRYSTSISNDQFFVIDETILEKIVEVAQITKKDRVLEVGTGLGFLTQKLAEKAGEVCTIEIDERFKPLLTKAANNVEIIWGDAYQLINTKEFRASQKSPTKMVANIPYSKAQNMLHNYTNYPWYEGDLVWLAPITLAEKVNQEPILGAYFRAEIIQEVPKTAFYPQPNTLSAIIYFHRVPDPILTKHFSFYFRRSLYNHEHVKVKNAIREGIIHAAIDLKNIIVSKKQAKTLLAELLIPEEELEKLTNNIRPEYYFEIPKKLKSWFDSL